MSEETRNHPLPSAAELARARWFTATASDARSCVEVAHLEHYTAVRDSKNPDGPVHFYTPHEWACFLAGAAKGEFHRP